MLAAAIAGGIVAGIEFDCGDDRGHGGGLRVVGTRPASAASFGVPAGGPTGGSTDGYFVLVGEDADPANNAFGDITNELTLFIEVTGNQLNLCVHDPGIWSAARPLEDFSFNTGSPYSAAMDYALYPPGSTTPLARDNTTWGADTAPSDGDCWTLYNGPVTPGVYTFVARMPDGPGADVDVNVFGVETTPDYNVYAYYATVGHSTWSGAPLATGAIKLYPWAAIGSRGTDRTGEEVCGLDLVTWDLDAAVSSAPPPDVTIRTGLGWTDSNPPHASLDGTFHLDHWPNMAPLNASDDHGIFTLEFARLGAADGVLEANLPSPPPGFDFNAFSMQVWDLGNAPPFDFSEYPIVPPDPRMSSRNSRRLYLPVSGSLAPAKEYLAHRITNPPAGKDYFSGVAVTVNVELRMENPTGYRLANVSGRTVLNPGPELSDPSNLTITGGIGGLVSSAGRVIDWSFSSIPAGATGVVSYSVDFTPGSSGFFFLTGDGSDFMGGAAPTFARWDTPFVAVETARPCAIETRVIIAPCGVSAVAAAPARVCGNDTVALDGSASTSVSCSGPLEYRWTGPGLPPSPPFGSDPTAAPIPPSSGNVDYTLDVRCQATPTCNDSQTVTVMVSSVARAIADAGADRVAGSCDVPFPIGTPGDTANFDYAWLPAGLVSNPAIPEPSFTQAAVGVYPLTLTVTPRADPQCAATDDLQIDVVSGTPTGSLGNRLEAGKQASDVALSWPLGVLTPDRYNVHRGTLKTELDKTAYSAPVLNPTSVLTGSYVDAGALAGPPDLYHYEVYGRDCAGQSVIQ